MSKRYWLSRILKSAVDFARNQFDFEKCKRAFLAKVLSDFYKETGEMVPALRDFRDTNDYFTFMMVVEMVNKYCEAFFARMGPNPTQ